MNTSSHSTGAKRLSVAGGENAITFQALIDKFGAEAWRRCGMAMIENVTPILRVENIAASRRYYIQTLGFSLDWDADGMISVSRDGKSIMLCEGDQGQPGTWIWIGVEDADAFFTEFSAKGARIRSPPQNFSWAYEFAVEDPDGHVLRFGSEPKSEPAYGGAYS